MVQFLILASVTQISWQKTNQEDVIVDVDELYSKSERFANRTESN